MSKMARKKIIRPIISAGAASNMKTKIRSILFRYMWYDVHFEYLLNI